MTKKYLVGIGTLGVAIAPITMAASCTSLFFKEHSIKILSHGEVKNEESIGFIKALLNDTTDDISQILFSYSLVFEKGDIRLKGEVVTLKYKSNDIAKREYLKWVPSASKDIVPKDGTIYLCYFNKEIISHQRNRDFKPFYSVLIVNDRDKKYTYTNIESKDGTEKIKNIFYEAEGKQRTVKSVVREITNLGYLDYIRSSSNDISGISSFTPITNNPKPLMHSTFESIPWKVIPWDMQILTKRDHITKGNYGTSTFKIIRGDKSQTITLPTLISDIRKSTNDGFVVTFSGASVPQLLSGSSIYIKASDLNKPITYSKEIGHLTDSLSLLKLVKPITLKSDSSIFEWNGRPLSGDVKVNITSSKPGNYIARTGIGSYYYTPQEVKGNTQHSSKLYYHLYSTGEKILPSLGLQIKSGRIARLDSDDYDTLGSGAIYDGLFGKLINSEDFILEDIPQSTTN